MAIIKLGGTVVGIRGTVGGVTYSANKAGPYAKAWGRPTNPRTARQQTGRGWMTQIGPQWQALTGAQRTAWDALAVTDPEPTFNSLGEAVTLSGFGYFTRCNRRRLQNGQAFLSAAPTGTDATRPATVTLSTFTVAHGTPATVSGTWPLGTIAATDYAVLMLAVLPSGAPIYTPSRLTWVGSAPGQSLAFVLGAEFSAAFGSVPANWVAVGSFGIQRASGLKSIVTQALAVIS